jgi:hypothetical protein
MATVMGGVGYGLYFVAKVTFYLYERPMQEADMKFSDMSIP